MSTEDSPMGPGFTGGTLSAVGLIKKINELTKHEDLLDGLVAFKELEAGTNQQITALFEEYCHHVACLIMNIRSVVDLEKFVIGGGISAQPLVIKGINQAYNDLYHTNEAVALTLCRPQITVAKFNNDANLYGALYQLLLTPLPKNSTNWLLNANYWLKLLSLIFPPNFMVNYKLSDIVPSY